MNVSSKPFLAAALFLLGSSYISSCRNADKCRSSVTCANHGSCNEGICTCPAGYEGATCQDVTRQKLLGNRMQKSAGKQSFPVSVSPGNDVTDIIITNFNNVSCPAIHGQVTGSTTVAIPSQSLGSGRVQGTLNYVPGGQLGTILVHYIITTPGSVAVQTVEATW